MDQISDYFYIGGHCCLYNDTIMHKHNIKRVVSVMKTKQLDANRIEHLKEQNKIEFLHVDVFDMNDEDLLTYLDSTYIFIDEAIQMKQPVFVHCMMGVSRSATIIIAYLMKSQKMFLNDAFKFVKQKRSFVRPNPGFFKQLKLYENMNCIVDFDDKQYKAYKLQMLTKNGHQMDSDEVQRLVAREISKSGDIFKCKKCRNIVFSHDQVISHYTGANCNAYEDETELEKVDHICTIDPYRLIPVKWMEQTLHSQQGKLYCPNEKCGSLLGKFDWKGQSCKCKAWIIPGIHIHSKYIDRSTCNSLGATLNHETP